MIMAGVQPSLKCYEVGDGVDVLTSIYSSQASLRFTSAMVEQLNRAVRSIRDPWPSPLLTMFPNGAAPDSL